MKNTLAAMNPFRKPTAAEYAQEQLNQLELQLMEYEALATFNTKMADYCRDSIKRLSARVQQTA